MQVRHILVRRVGRHHLLSLNLIRFSRLNSDLTELTEANYYSEYEYQCGNWFGQPLYRKVFRNTGQGVRNFDIGINYLNIRKIEGYMKFSDMGYVIPPYFQTATDFFNYFVQGTTCHVRGAGAVVSNANEFTLIVEYTK